MLYISLGILKIKSELADTTNENNIYDIYIVKFDNFVMKTVDVYNSQEIIKDDIGEKIFYKTSFNTGDNFSFFHKSFTKNSGL